MKHTQVSRLEILAYCFRLTSPGRSVSWRIATPSRWPDARLPDGQGLLTGESDRITRNLWHSKTNFQISNFKFQISNSWRSQAGFTLLEMMIVMAIIAILTSVLWSNFATSLAKGRDSRRKQDLELIVKALELYYNDNKAYPTSLPDAGTAFTHPQNSSVIYMPKVPSDPAYPNAIYCYPTTAAGSYYQLYANLENTKDPKIIPTVACDGVNYNYGISSPNVTP
jgi:general secretion pathway protein G